MRRGFAHHAVLIFTLFASVPVMMWAYLSHKNAEAAPSVRGTSVQEEYRGSSFEVRVSSPGGSWDLFQYFCKTKEDCEGALEGGTRWETLSGGQTEEHDVINGEIPEWNAYRFIKLFVKPSWGSAYRKFEVEVIGEGETQTLEFKNESEYIKAVILPIDAVREGLVREVSFSDQSL